MMEYSNQHSNDGLLLPPEIFSQILPYLAPREMFTMVQTGGKFIMDYLTYQDLVRSAAPTVPCLPAFLDLLHKQAIYMPSKLRFLQLMNGTKCERCGSSSSLSNKHKSDIEGSAAAAAGVTLESLGLCYCAKCLQGHFGNYCAYINKPHVLMITSENDRIAVSKGQYVVNMLEETHVVRNYNISKMNDKESKPAQREEKCGPIITRNVMEYMMDQEMGLDGYFAAKVENLPDRAFVEELQQIQSQQSYLQAQGPIVSIRHTQQTLETRLQQIVSQVEDRFKPCLSFEFQDDLLLPLFKYASVGSLLRPYLKENRNPPTISAALIGMKINMTLRKIEQSPMWNVEKLSHNKEEQPLQAHLRAHLHARNEELASLSAKLEVPNCLEIMLNAQNSENGTDFGTLLRLAFADDSSSSDRLSPSYIPPKFVNFVADVIASSSSSGEACESCSHENMNAFAKSVCHHVWWRGLHFLGEEPVNRKNCLEVCQQFHSRSLDIYQSLLRKVLEYTNSKETLDFIANGSSVDDDDCSSIEVRQQAVNEIWTTVSAGVLYQVSKRKFGDLRSLHHSRAKYLASC